MKIEKKRIAILGSTGSIGLSALSVIEELGPGYAIQALSGHQNWQELARQGLKYHPRKIALTDTAHLTEFKEALGTEKNIEILSGPESLKELALDPDCDVIIVAVVGVAALAAVLAGIEAGKTMALANKEALVCAGDLVMSLARDKGVQVLPIDSEHSAIHQAMSCGERREVKKVILTASGGPFRTASLDEIDQVGLKEALNHPTWDMGPKITIDSATMMNKALEIVEARWLFDLDPEQIEVLIHPESIIHSLVEFCDGSVIAQLSRPDMRLPIQYALTYPNRLPCPTARLNLHELGQLNFQAPDTKRFPAVRLGFEVARRGGTAGAVLNAANEAAVEAFQAEKIGFTQIAELTESCLVNHKFVEHPDLQQLIQADQRARAEIDRLVNTPEHAST